MNTPALMIRAAGWVTVGAAGGLALGGAVFYALLIFGGDLDWLDDTF